MKSSGVWNRNDTNIILPRPDNLLSDKKLEAKIIKEGEGAQKVYDEFAEFCDDRSKDLGFEIKTGKKNKEK